MLYTPISCRCFQDAAPQFSGCPPSFFCFIVKTKVFSDGFVVVAVPMSTAPLVESTVVDGDFVFDAIV